MHLSIVIPMYKSAATLAELHDRIGRVAAAQAWDCEVIYVDDASPDGSVAVIQSLASAPPHRLVRLRSNHGQSTALLCGIFFSKGKYVVTMDADLQDQPEHLPSLLSAFTFNPTIQVAFAGRVGQYESKGKLTTSLIFKSMVHWLSGRRVPANAGLFMIIGNNAAQKLLPFVSNKPYVIGLIAKLRLRCVSIQVPRKANQLGETSYTTKKRIRVAIQFFKTLTMRPNADSGEIAAWIVSNTLPETS